LNQLEEITIVSDYLGSDAFFYDPLTEAFRRSLAQLDRMLAQICDAVVEICAGQPIIHKGQDYFLSDPLPSLTSGAGVFDETDEGVVDDLGHVHHRAGTPSLG